MIPGYVICPIVPEEIRCGTYGYGYGTRTDTVGYGLSIPGYVLSCFALKKGKKLAKKHTDRSWAASN